MGEHRRDDLGLPGGIYEIVKVLPENNGDRVYRIKRESALTKA
jgi:hypothetical protein